MKEENANHQKTVHKFAEILEVNTNDFMLKKNYEIGDDDLALQAMIAAEAEIKYKLSSNKLAIPKIYQNLNKIKPVNT